MKEASSSYKGLMIAGTHSGVGKTTVTMGIMEALSKSCSVQGFKVGPDYIDTAYHSFVTGNKSRNLDNYMMQDKYIVKSFHHNMKGKDIGIIEGAMGLYDGSLASPDKGSSSSISKVLQCPVVLVIDGSGMALSAAALVKGYCDFDPSVQITGIIINRINSQSHYALLKKAIESNTSVKCLGYVPKTLPQLPSRHLGLVPSGEIEDLKEKLQQIASLISETVDLEALVRLAKVYSYDDAINISDVISHELPDSLVISQKYQHTNQNNEDRIRIGVAYDQSFNFYYEDNLDYLRRLGADIIYFSPMNDAKLPENLDFLYFGGGYPEQFAQKLSENKTMHKSILHALASGIPYYGECGGFMYLNKELIDFDGKRYPMVGWFDGSVSMTKKLQRFGYKTLELQEECILGAKQLKINCHEFHHSLVENIQLEPLFSLSKYRDHELIDQNYCGFQKGNGVAGYPHLHFYGNEEVPRNLIRKAMEWHQH